MWKVPATLVDHSIDDGLVSCPVNFEGGKRLAPQFRAVEEAVASIESRRLSVSCLPSSFVSNLIRKSVPADSHPKNVTQADLDFGTVDLGIVSHPIQRDANGKNPFRGDPGDFIPNSFSEFIFTGEENRATLASRSRLREQGRKWA